MNDIFSSKNFFSPTYHKSLKQISKKPFKDFFWKEEYKYSKRTLLVKNKSNSKQLVAFKSLSKQWLKQSKEKSKHGFLRERLYKRFLKTHYKYISFFFGSSWVFSIKHYNILFLTKNKLLKFLFKKIFIIKKAVFLMKENFLI